jgi:hypothetical protein
MNKKPKGSKIESFNGFIKQVPRAMFYLINGAHSVKIETEDDISVEDINGNIEIIEQLKTKQSKNIFSNSSEDLWETLYTWVYNWVENAEIYKVTEDTKFILYTTNMDSKKGECLKKLLGIDGSESFDQALVFCESKISPKNENLQKWFKYIKDNKKISYKIVKNLKIELPKISIASDLDSLIIKKYQENLGIAFDTFSERLNGWYAKKLIINRENDELKKCTITSIELHAFYMKFSNFAKKIEYVTGDLTDEERDKYENKLFVAQLNEVNIDKEVIQYAQNSYKSWLNFQDSDLLKGMSTQDLLDEAYARLKKRWRENKDELCSSSTTEELQGKSLYYRSIKEPLCIDNIEIIGNIDEASRGVHNFLADKPISHNHSIGWHPKYTDKFKNGDYNEK